MSSNEPRCVQKQNTACAKRAARWRHAGGTPSLEYQDEMETFALRSAARLALPQALP